MHYYTIMMTPDWSLASLRLVLLSL